MNKTVLLNVLFNVAFATVFVWLNNWALRNQLEETFVSLAMFYGFAVIVINGAFVAFACRKVGDEQAFAKRREVTSSQQ
jgi:hypothetical protein